MFTVKVATLSREDGESLTELDLTPGNQLLMEMNKKSYPISVIKIISGTHITSGVNTIDI